MKKITISITPAGTPTIDVEGFKGKGCADATQQIELVLGGAGVKKSTKKKPEFFQPAGAAAKSKLTF